jgi:hypothetical protein
MGLEDDPAIAYAARLGLLKWAAPPFRLRSWESYCGQAGPFQSERDDIAAPA